MSVADMWAWAKYQTEIARYVAQRKWWDATPWWTRTRPCGCVFRRGMRKVFCAHHLVAYLRRKETS